MTSRGVLLVLIALPGTQGFYGFVCAFIIASKSGLLGGADGVVITPTVGFAMMFIGIGAGVVLWLSAVNQGQASAASINLTAKKPEQAGRSILFPALVETYAVVALLAAILLINWVTGVTKVAPTLLAQ